MLPPEMLSVITTKSIMVDSSTGIRIRFNIWNAGSKPLRLRLEDYNNNYYIGLMMLSLCHKVLMDAKNSRLGVAILHMSERMHHAGENRLRKSTNTKNMNRKRARGSNNLNISF